LLLSTYLSYRLVGSVSPSSQMFVMMFFTVVFSGLSAFFPASEWMFLFMIPFVSFFPVVSFPFYSWVIELAASEALRQRDIYWIYHRGLSFLTAEIASIPEVEIQNGVLLRHDLLREQLVVHAFTFFLIFNILGALLGYWIGKKYEIKFFSTKRWLALCGLVGVCILALGFVVYAVIPKPPYPLPLSYKLRGIIIWGGMYFCFDIIFLEILVLRTVPMFKGLGVRTSLTQITKNILLKTFYFLQGLGSFIFGLLELIRYIYYDPIFGFSIGIPFVLASCFSFLTAYELSKGRKTTALTWGSISSLLFIVSYGYGLLDYRFNLTQLYSIYHFSFLFNVVLIILNAMSIFFLYQSSLMSKERVL